MFELLFNFLLPKFQVSTWLKLSSIVLDHFDRQLSIYRVVSLLSLWVYFASEESNLKKDSFETNTRTFLLALVSFLLCLYSYLMIKEFFFFTSKLDLNIPKYLHEPLATQCWLLTSLKYLDFVKHKWSDIICFFNSWLLLFEKCPRFHRLKIDDKSKILWQLAVVAE